MTHSFRTLATHTLLGLSLLGSCALASANTIEDAIKFRQAGYTFMSWNMGKIKAQVIDGSTPYNREQVIAAANAIAGVANSGMGALYPPGSDRGTGFKPTRLKPEFFTKLDEVGRIARNFTAAANTLASTAQTGDQAAIRKAFGALGESCKACHDQFRAE